MKQRNEKEVFTCVKKFTFDSAHFLPDYEGECSKLHGHTWTVEIAISGNKLQDNGILIDFNDLSFYIEKLKKRYDHAMLNDIILYPTAENIARDIYNFLSEKIDNKDLCISYISVQETPNNKLIYNVEKC